MKFPDVASDSQGNFVVVYQSFKHPFDGDGDAIVGQRFTSFNAREGVEFLVNTIREGDQQDPSVGRQPDGDFLVAWESDDTNNTGIFAQTRVASSRMISSTSTRSARAIRSRRTLGPGQVDMS